MELKREARLLYCTVATSQKGLLHPCCISVWDVLPRQHPCSPTAAPSAVAEQRTEQLLIDTLH